MTALQREALSPLAHAVDTLIQDATAVDLMVDARATELTGDEVCEFATAIGYLLVCAQSLRETVQALERRLRAEKDFDAIL